MASFTALGVGSGMDLSSLLTNLLTAERAPKDALLKQQLTSYNSKISGLGTLNSKLSSLQTAYQALKPSATESLAEKFATYTGSLDAEVGKVTVGAGAVAGNYNLKVTQLAQAQKSVTNAVTDTRLPNSAQAFEIKFAEGSSRTDVSIAGQTTLEGLRDAINAETDASGVTATIVNDGAGKRLELTGVDDNFTVSGAGLGIDASKTSGNKSVTNVVTGTALPNSSEAFVINGRTNVTITGQTTLEGLRDAINAKQNESGVAATIINDGTGKRLVLSGSDGDAFTATGAGLGFDASKAVAAKDALFSIDGISLSSKSNKITNAIDGLTIELTGTTTGTTLSIAKESDSKLKSALETFVKAYNDAASSIKSLGAYNSETKVAGALQGNNVLRETQSMLSRLVSDTGVGTGFDKQTLSSIGISVSKTGDGTLSIDADKLAAAIAKDPNAVATLAAEVGRAFDDHDKGLGRIIGTGGRIPTSTDSLKMNVKDVEKRQEALELRMEKVEARYRAQFTALDTLLAGLNTLSSSLASSLGSLQTSYTK